MKTILSILILAATLVSTWGAAVSVVNISATNSIAVNTTISENMGNAVQIANHRDVGLEVRFQGSAAGTTAVIYTFLRSNDGTTWETVPGLTAGFAQNGTTAVVGYTNLPLAAIGAAGWIKLSSVQNQDADAVLTNHSVRIILKR